MFPVDCMVPLAEKRRQPALRRWLRVAVVSVMAAVWLAPLAAWAQTPLVWDRAEIQLWPEYDRPATLVIFDGWLPTATSLPTTLNVRLPAAAAEPHAVAVRTTAGDLLDATYTTAPAEDDIIVTFTTDQLSFRIEYYDPAVSITGNVRALALDWTSAYAIDAVSVRVQEPVGASGLSGSPALLALGAGADGLNYYQRDFGALPAGGQVALSLNYTKATSTLSADALGPSVPNTASSTTAAPANNTNLLVLLGGAAVGLGLLALGAFIYLRGRPLPAGRVGRPAAAKRAARSQPATARRRHAGERRGAPAGSLASGNRTPSGAPAANRAAPARKREAGPVAPPAPNGQAFCTRCGHRLQADDRFCRQCGAPIAPA
jgi:hypothetical protein